MAQRRSVRDNMDAHLSETLSIDDLLYRKLLDPLPPDAITELERICSLNVSGYSEADVREEIISPLLRILGYDESSYFSIDREKPIRVLGRRQFIDYNLTLWAENFWLIEAKRPKGHAGRFSFEDLSQAVGYATHPDINAALVVLCDGRKIEVYDREVSLVEPLLEVQKETLVRDINKVRALLSPWQIWLFEKRRIARLIDKVFDREFNLARVEEFRRLIDRCLEMKRNIVVDNYRAMIEFTDDDDEVEQAIDIAEPVDLIEAHFL